LWLIFYFFDYLFSLNVLLFAFVVVVVVVVDDDDGNCQFDFAI